MTDSITDSKAIEEIRFNMSTIGLCNESAKRVVEARDMAINALEKIQQYKALGTVEELRLAKEKKTPKKPIFTEDKQFVLCPFCDMKGLKDKQKYCDNCGQAIDWSDKE